MSIRTAAQLNIADWEHAQLIQLLEDLDDDVITHVPEDDVYDFMPNVSHDPNKIGFDMSVGGTAKNHSCGSAACIGGTIWLRENVAHHITRSALDKARDYVCEKLPSNALHPLFFPRELHGWQNIKPTTAAAAIRSFLTTRSPNWPEAAITSGQPELLK